MKEVIYENDNLSECGNGYCSLPQCENCGNNFNDCCFHTDVSKASMITDENLIDQIEGFLTVRRFETAKS